MTESQRLDLLDFSSTETLPPKLRAMYIEKNNRRKFIRENNKEISAHESRRAQILHWTPEKIPIL